jgi:DNA-binding NarL/FixJ family response regulator
VIIVSELRDEEVVARAFQVGATAVLHKHEMVRELPGTLLALMDGPSED